ncbi:MAG: GNAT family N-acetyltransferase [Saprospiraceae bacterium]|nr:GNAT family N-acetyltransferase [Saprospiraceae bacterium]
MYVIEIEFATPEYDDAVRLRYEVLRKPLGLEYTPEQLAAEYDNYHLAAYTNNGQLIGYLNLTPFEGRAIKMRQVAVEPHAQGLGTGRKLVEASEILARKMGYQTMVLHARESAVAFYQKLDYKVVGERFEEVSIPHFFMEKAL